MKNIKASWNLLRRFIDPIKYAKGWWGCVLFAEIFDAFQSVFVVQIGVYIISAIEQKDPVHIKFWGGILIGIFLLNYFFLWVREMTREVFNGKSKIGLRREYFDKYIHLDNTKVETIGTGKMQSIIFDGINNWSGTLGEVGIFLLVEMGAILYAFILMAQQSPNWKYFVVFLGLFGISTVLIRVGLGVLQKTRRVSKELALDLTRRDVKILMSKFEILQNNKLSVEIDKQEEIIDQLVSMWQRGNTVKNIRQTGANFILDGMQVWVYMGVGMSVITGHYTFAYMMLLLQLLRIISRYVWNIRGYLKEIYKSSVHIEKFWETFDTIPSMKDDSTKKDFLYKKGNVMLKNISFAYDKNPVFQDFSLTLSGGTKTAFVGESGGGKTTLIKLLAGYIRPDAGEIAIDHQKLSETKLSDYYQHIGYLTQDPSVFDGTIRENLMYGLNNSPSILEGVRGSNISEYIKKVIKDSKCEFIREFEHGLDTEIGERGVRLSGGQKQRLAIAKIMLKNPNIIFLDEPTSALDSFNEEQVNIALHNLFKSKTVIVVAHRLQTVKQADRILFIENGQVIEDGTHEELVKAKGRYKKMLDLQSGF